MAVPIHRDLQRRMSRERLHRFGREPGLDPARHREFDQIIMAEMVTFPVRED
jgi:hypothetical protein